jgi:hypothetical protein
MMRVVLLAVVLLLTGAASTGNAFAQAVAVPLSHALISDAALAGSAGNIAINNSAGAGNAQANIAVIGIADEVASADIGSRQSAGEMPAVRGNRIAEIGADAFRHAAGIITVNQSSGNGNAQANLVAVAAGKISEVSIDQLGRVSVPRDGSSIASGNADDTGTRKSAIADSAFIGARGIVQVNQLAGSGNSSANVFALSIGTGTQ